jgi:UDP-glucuronate decarboxylase
VDDLIDGFVRLMEHEPESGAAPFTGPVNLGNPGEFTMRELADEVLRQTGSRSRIAFHPLPADDPTQRQPDIALAKSVLGWQPAVPLAEGLERTIGYFRDLLERSGA